MENLTWLHLFVLVFATFRLTHLIVYDKITAFIRRPFLETVTEPTEEDGPPQQVVQIRGSGLRYFIGSLLSCHWCTGIWCAIVIVAVAFYLPIAFPVLVVLAIAGVAAVVESFIP